MKKIILYGVTSVELRRNIEFFWIETAKSLAIQIPIIGKMCWTESHFLCRRSSITANLTVLSRFHFK